MSDISEWSTTASNNNASPPDGWPEGQAPSTVNNCARENMAAVRRWYEEAQWQDYGFTVNQLSGTKFEVDSATSTAVNWFNVNRRVRLHDGSSTFYGFVTEASISATKTNVTVSLDSGALTSSLTAVDVGIITPTNNALPSNISGMELLNRQTVTSVSSINFASLLTSRFFGYKLLMDYIHPATDGAFLQLRFSTNNGSSYISTASYTRDLVDNGTSSKGSAQTEIFLTNAVGFTSLVEAAWGELVILNPTRSTTYTTCIFQTFWLDTSGGIHAGHGGGYYAAAAAVDAFQLSFSTGNISSGTVRLYGLYDQ